MIKFNKSNTSLHRNGNIAMRLFDPRVWPHKEHLKEVEILWDSGNGQKQKKGLLNTGNEAILLKRGYDTTAGGGCDDLILEPGEAMILSACGDLYSFSHYRKMRIA